MKDKCCDDDTTIIGVLQLKKSDAILRNPDDNSWYIKNIKPAGYKFVYHSNGVIRFKPIGDEMSHIIALARVDSQSFCELILNLIHGSRFGCFCFGMITEDDKFMRWNRWHGSLKYYYTATKDKQL